MAQNIYDDETFFARYSELPRSLHGLEAAPEFPALAAMLPCLEGLDVLDLGCGFGWFCRWARAHGANTVLGVDLSERMLARATEMTADPAIAYRRANLDDIDLRGHQFGLAFSSLALHYVEDLARLLREIRSTLSAGGRFVFSVEHPIYTAPADPGWSDSPEGRRSWPVDGYLHEGPRTTNWLAGGVIKQHRTIATYVRALLASGFAITDLEEWGPTQEQMAAHPEWAGERERPAFLLVAATAR